MGVYSAHPTGRRGRAPVRVGSVGMGQCVHAHGCGVCREGACIDWAWHFTSLCRAGPLQAAWWRGRVSPATPPLPCQEGMWWSCQGVCSVHVCVGGVARRCNTPHGAYMVSAFCKLPPTPSEGQGRARGGQCVALGHNVRCSAHGWDRMMILETVLVCLTLNND